MTAVARYEIAERFPVVVLYDHFSSVGVALATYSHLASELQSEFQTELRMWRMDVATSFEFSDAANNDIAAAEVIIVTVRGNQPWPAAFWHWETGTNQDEALSPHAIVTVINADEGPSAVAGVWNSKLGAAATQIHPEVFVYETKMPEEEGSDARAGFGERMENCHGAVQSCCKTREP